MKKATTSNFAPLVISLFFFTLAILGGLSQLQGSITFFDTEFDLRSWASFLTALLFAVLAWHGLKSGEDASSSGQNLASQQRIVPKNKEYIYPHLDNREYTDRAGIVHNNQSPYIPFLK